MSPLVQVLVRRGDAPASDSDFEVRLLQVLRDGGLPAPVRQQHFYDDDGFIARVDFVYPIARVIIEADSYRHHGGRQDWEDDNDRRARLTALGYRIIPITWRMVNDRPAEVCSRVARSLRTTTP